MEGPVRRGEDGGPPVRSPSCLKVFLTKKILILQTAQMTGVFSFVPGSKVIKNPDDERRLSVIRILCFVLSSPELIMPSPPIGVVTAATATMEAGHQVKIVEFKAGANMESMMQDAVASFPPDAVCIAVRNIDNQGMSGNRTGPHCCGGRLHSGR